MLKKLSFLLLSLSMCIIVACKNEAVGDNSGQIDGVWRYKETVTVITPEGIKSGYSVREISNSIPLIKIDLPQVVNPPDVRGEAVVVDLGKRGKLFAVMKGYISGEDYADSVVTRYFGGGGTAEGIKHLDTLRNARATLKPRDYPILVTYPDPTDIMSVTPVIEVGRAHPNSKEFVVTSDHFEKLFGKGVRLKSITIETTDEPVTTGIKEVMPPYGGNDPAFLQWLRTLKYGDPRAIGTNNFYKR